MTPDKTYKNEAEVALKLQYDRQIEEFFLLEREKARSQREASGQNLPFNLLQNQKGHIILNPTDSKEESCLNLNSEEDFGWVIFWLTKKKALDDLQIG